MSQSPQITHPVRAEEGDDGRWTLVVVRDVAHPPAAVWSALTDPDQVRVWGPYLPARDLGTAGPATLQMLEGGAPTTDEPLQGEVLTAAPPHVLEHRWGDDVLRWELTETDAGTRLTLRHSTNAFPGLSSFAAGWHLCLDSLQSSLGGEVTASVAGDAALGHGWVELEAAYREELPAER